MFWKKKREKKKSSNSDEPSEIRAYSKEGGYIKSLERQGLTTSAAYGGMGVRELQLRMELIIESALSSNRSVFEPAKILAEFAKIEQDRFLSTVEMVSNINIELAYNFCNLAPYSISLIDEQHWENWIKTIIDVYKNKDIDEAIKIIKSAEQYVESVTHSPASVALSDVSRILENFLVGLNGRKLSIEQNDMCYTDTEIIRLPEIISEFNSREFNFSIFKAMAVHQWAQTWFGTWRMNVDALAKLYKDQNRALSIFHKLETIRLDACINRELPGLSREIQHLVNHDNREYSKKWMLAVKKLQEEKSTVQDTMFFLETVYKDEIFPEDKIYQGTLNPREAWVTIQKRIQHEKNTLNDRLSELLNELKNSSHHQDIQDKAPSSDENGIFSIEINEDENSPDEINLDFQYNDKSIDAPEDIQQLLESIYQDLGEIPDEYIKPTERRHYDAEHESEEVIDTDLHVFNRDFYLYDEWDHSRQKYRKEWCHLKEITIKPVHDNFVSNTLLKHHNLIKQLHRTFEALREDDKRIKRQPFGDDIDLDAVIEAFSDTAQGIEPSQNLFTKSRKIDRNIAVMFMIDMSASTSGWINEMERESLVLLCESLEILGDRYAIYGFSGVTHERCELYKIKGFEETYNDEVKSRISGIQPQDYTRMGAAIRHLSQILNQIEARTKLLITLSDGRPDDQDGYRGPYGIEDTRRSLIEAKFLGIHPFCITIDKEAMDYLEHMYGAVNYAVVDQVDKLPYKVSDIYRRITV